MIPPAPEVLKRSLSRDVGRCALCNADKGLGYVPRLEHPRSGRHLGVLEGVTLCGECHRGILTDRRMLIVSRAFGVRIPTLTDPGRVPLYYAHEFTWCRLEGIDRHPITHHVAIDLMASVYGRAHRAWWQEATGS